MDNVTIFDHLNSCGAVCLDSTLEIDNKFLELLKYMEVTIVCDIGSRDARMAGLCKQHLPNADVFAFEANPENYFEFALKARSYGVNFIPVAISNEDSITYINVPTYASKYSDASINKRGIASLKRRVKDNDYVCYKIPSMRFDSFFQLKEHQDQLFALWVDVEGMSFEVVNGISDSMLKNILVIKIEVEVSSFWADQHLCNENVQYLTSKGFRPIFYNRHPKQFDIIFSQQPVGPVADN